MSSEDNLLKLDDFSDDVSESTLMMPPHRFLGLVSYLGLLRDAAFTPAKAWVGTPPDLTLVTGNPSADLDSIVSAIVFSYFQNSCIRGGYPMYGVRKKFDREDPSRRLFMSLINMPRTSSQTDLRRLRPELGVALREAFKVGLRRGHGHGDSGLEGRKPEEVEESLCKGLLTTHDLTQVDQTFQDLKVCLEEANDSQPPKSKQQLILVDHNAPSLPTLSPNHISAHFSVTGCIDHHVDENHVPQGPEIKPRIIKTGIGSCTSLIVQYLRESGAWPDVTRQKQNADATPEDLDEDDILALRQISALALAPILVDTSNLKAGGEKCSDTDRDAVAFLEAQINPPLEADPTIQSQWSRGQMYAEISEAKTNALDHLTMDEVFDHDYKQWNEEISLGISSIVKPISWLIENPCRGKPANFIDALRAFANNDLRNLGILVFSTRGVKDKAKELGAVPFTKEGEKAIASFEKNARQELDLEEWDGDNRLQEHMRKEFQDQAWRLWWMKDVAKTRKQIAPLMRNAVKSIE